MASQVELKSLNTVAVEFTLQTDVTTAESN